MFPKLFSNLIPFYTWIPPRFLTGISCNSQLMTVGKAGYLWHKESTVWTSLWSLKRDPSMPGTGSCAAGLLSPCYGVVPSRGPQRFPAESRGGRKGGNEDGERIGCFSKETKPCFICYVPDVAEHSKQLVGIWWLNYNRTCLFLSAFMVFSGNICEIWVSLLQKT